jgi:hypothetical protein
MDEPEYCLSWMEAAALVNAKLPFADESYCVDVKLLFEDEIHCSWTNQNTAAWMRNCPSWMKTAAGGRTRILSHHGWKLLACGCQNCPAQMKAAAQMSSCPSRMKAATRGCQIALRG